MTLSQTLTHIYTTHAHTHIRTTHTHIHTHARKRAVRTRWLLISANANGGPTPARRWGYEAIIVGPVRSQSSALGVRDTGRRGPRRRTTPVGHTAARRRRRIFINNNNTFTTDIRIYAHTYSVICIPDDAPNNKGRCARSFPSSRTVYIRYDRTFLFYRPPPGRFHQPRRTIITNDLKFTLRSTFVIFFYAMITNNEHKYRVIYSVK